MSRSAQPASPDRPNILPILNDDMGYSGGIADGGTLRHQPGQLPDILATVLKVTGAPLGTLSPRRRQKRNPEPRRGGAPMLRPARRRLSALGRPPPPCGVLDWDDLQQRRRTRRA